MARRLHLSRLLDSPAFVEARRQAGAVVDDPERLRVLLDGIDRKEFAAGRLQRLPGSVNVDLACAVVEAHLETLLAGQPVARSITEDARLRLIVAGLMYVEREDDLLPDDKPYGHHDDLEVMAWVVRVVQHELPPHPSAIG